MLKRVVVLVLVGCIDRGEPKVETRGRALHRTLQDIVGGVPPSQPVQNYIVESLAFARYNHRPLGGADYRSRDGLVSFPLWRMVNDPAVCLVGLETRPDIRDAIEGEITRSLAILSDGHLTPRFEAAGCLAGVTNFCAQVTRGSTTTPHITIQLEDPERSGNPCPGGGGASVGRNGNLGTGGVINMGELLQSPPAGYLLYVLRHELSHIAGMSHTFGDPDNMSYRVSTEDYDLDHERTAFAILNAVPPGTRIDDLIRLGVLDDDWTTFAEATSIDLILPQSNPRVGDEIVIAGQRLTIPLQTERANANRPYGYAPPVVRFGPQEIVVNPTLSYQEPLIYGSENFKVRIPPGTPPLTGTTEVTRGDWYARCGGDRNCVTPRSGYSTAALILAGTLPPLSPASPTGVSCGRTALGHHLLWTPPQAFLDGTSLDVSTTSVTISRNGVAVARLPGATVAYTDTGSYPSYESHLYQVTYLGPNGEDGQPSPVCVGYPSRTVVAFLIDQTGSMADRTSDGSTRFDHAVGNITPDGVLSAIDDLEAQRSNLGEPPLIAVFSFRTVIGAPQAPRIVDRVEQLTGATYTTNYSVARAAVDEVRREGPIGATPLAEAMCATFWTLIDDVTEPGVSTKLHIFTDGGENDSVFSSRCFNSACRAAPSWHPFCSPGTCGMGGVRTSVNCTQCQDDFLSLFCGGGIEISVDYYGREGPFSPLPLDAGILLALAQGTGGSFRHHGDKGGLTYGLVGEMVPIVHLGHAIDVECTGPSTQVHLRADVADDDPLESLRFNWSVPLNPGLPSQAAVEVSLPVGSHTIEVVVSDDHLDSEPAIAIAHITDSSAPTISISASLGEVWPPDGRMIPIEIEVSAQDSCSTAVVRLLSIVSSEASAEPYFEGVAIGSDDRSFSLRARRTSSEDRTYTITYEAEDESGNRATASTTVRVLHDRRR